MKENYIQNKIVRYMQQYLVVFAIICFIFMFKTRILIVLAVILQCIFTLRLNPSQSYINPSLYRKSAELQSQITKITLNNNNMHKRNCTKSEKTYQIVSIDQLKQQGKQSQKRLGKTLNAIITCGIHARQLYTSEACLQFVRNLAQNTDNRIKFLRQNIKFTIFYNGNQMRDKVIDGQYCRRTNQNDVDINRNFPAGFLGQDKSQQTNPGPKPLSQAFSQCIQQQITNNFPDIFLDIHTGQFSLYFAATDNQTDKAHKIQQNVLNSIVNNVCSNCRIRDDQLQGVMFVDIKTRRNVKWANLFQVYGGYNVNLNQNQFCFVIFNPTTKKALEFYKRRTKNMLIQYFYNIIQNQRPVANNNHFHN